MEQLLNRRYLPSSEIVVVDAGYASEQYYILLAIKRASFSDVSSVQYVRKRKDTQIR